MKKQIKKTKFVFITGGTISGVGKGISVASIGLLLQSRGYNVLPIKMDPYLNKDAGTMNPYQHGEVFVTDDGAETDLDLGHYERFMGINLDKDSNFTTGSVYAKILETERQGNFLGETIQIIPHITQEIKQRITGAAKRKQADITVVETGGTVGDIEAEPFLESVRQLGAELGPTNTAFIHVVKMDYVFPSDEAKTKPIQQSVRLLRERGIQPDFLIVRCKRALTRSDKEKISLFTNVPLKNVIEAVDVTSLYQVPINFKKSKIDELLLQKLNLSLRHLRLETWQRTLKRLWRIRRSVKIGLVGKYVANDDAYISVEEAVSHAAAHLGARADIVRIDAEKNNPVMALRQVDCLIIPGGFGRRGIEGKIKAISFARTHNLPFLGLCLGLQTAVIEFARNVARLSGANSTEFSRRTPHPVIDFLPDQKNLKIKGGTMRLGSFDVKLERNTLAHNLYGKERVQDRHRHRYEVNPRYHEVLRKHGLVFSGMSVADKRLVDLVELPKHRFFIATQAHPEFKSRLLNPHPLFLGLLRAALQKK